MSNADAIQKRRIFGIISHPDAGKTTLTEKLLLHGGTGFVDGRVAGDDGCLLKSVQVTYQLA